jgi:2-phospho-L-lactate guanylyltransferase
MIVVAVPVKDLINAKQRLVPVLGPAERMALARGMLHDVLRALARSGVDAVWVVTRDAEAAAIARGHGVEVLAEADNRGHTAAVAFAQRAAHERGARTFLTVPGDVPCVRPDEVRALAAAAATAPAVAFAASRSGRGTNGVALAPPAIMPLTFGEPSFDNHLAAARARALAPRVLALPGLALDIDDADDLRELLARGAGTESAALVAGWTLGAPSAERRPGGRTPVPGSTPDGRAEIPGWRADTPEWRADAPVRAVETRSWRARTRPE